VDRNSASWNRLIGWLGQVEHLRDAVFDFSNLLKPAPTLFRPGIVARVFRARVALNGPLALESDRPITTPHHRVLETH
jgi:hypothetical protein